jgi:hypothetical protein
MTKVYVYALVERPPVRGKSAVRRLVAGRHRIEFVSIRGIYAAIERRRTQPGFSEASLRDQHRLVVALARRCDAILPVRFGGLVTLAELERLVEAREQALRRAIEQVRYREQMTVRIFSDDERRGGPTPAAATGTAYLHARKAAASPKLTPLASSIREAVAPLAVDERIDAGRGRLQLAFHHLVDRGRSADYEARVEGVVSRSNAADSIVISGPWPPFAFVPDLWV